MRSLRLLGWVAVAPLLVVAVTIAYWHDKRACLRDLR